MQIENKFDLKLIHCLKCNVIFTNCEVNLPAQYKNQRQLITKIGFFTPIIIKLQYNNSILNKNLI